MVVVYQSGKKGASDEEDITDSKGCKVRRATLKDALYAREMPRAGYYCRSLRREMEIIP